MVALLLVVLSQTPRTLEVTSSEPTCFVALPANGRVRLYQGGAASIWLRERGERLVLGEGESWVSIYDADAKTWTDVRYLVRLQAKSTSKARVRRDPDRLPAACVLGGSRSELEVPLGGSCVTTVDGISRVAV